VFRAPGRVNLIGEHTDYNDGFVLPAAIGFAAWAAVTPGDDRVLRIHSAHFSETVELSLDGPSPEPRRHWSDYVIGMAAGLEKSGYRLRGADLEIRGDIPPGAGLGSSAAIEMAAGCALAAGSGHEIGRVELARIGQRVENEFVGTRCGIMDQFVSLCATEGHALLVDCRSLDSRPIPIPPAARILVANTMVRHELATGEYNTRRSECEAGVRRLGAGALREVAPADIERLAGWNEVVYRRCRHVTRENERVLEAVEALEAGDLARFGRLMDASHQSLRDDYEVSCAELDRMVELARRCEGVYGARMTGGGFGGCTVSLVDAGRAEEAREKLVHDYGLASGSRPEVYLFTPAGGASEVS